jgi:hypothetical protein
MLVRYIPIVVAVGFLIAAGANSTETAPAPDSNPASRMAAGSAPANGPGGEAGGKAPERIREGTKLVDVLGSFQSAGGDSITFSREGGKDSFRVLENLNLQRIGQMLEENRGGTRQWVVSGMITEFRGANYLLVSKFIQAEEKDAAANP